MEIFITVNSPGEIAGWLRPVSRKIKEKYPSHKITTILLPCLFASGREEEVIERIPWVDEVQPSRNFFSHLRSKKKDDALLLHLGGDLMYAAMLARKWKIPAWAYIWANRRWDKYFCGYLVRDERELKRLEKNCIPPGKISIVGDMLVDSVHDNITTDTVKNNSTTGFRICYLPGSRLKEVYYMGAFFLKISEIIGKNFSGSEFNLLISPFLKIEEVMDVLRKKPDRKMGGSSGKISENEKTFNGSGDISIRLLGESHYEYLKNSDIAISVPGTKTGETGILGIPFITVLPLNRVEEVPFFGMVGLMELIPFFGKKFKGFLMAKIASKFGYISQPNILAEREIIPEMMRWLTPEEVAEEAIKLLEDKERRDRISQELRDLYQPHRGASERVVNKILG